MSWWPVIATAAGLAALKQLGTALPKRLLDRPLVATLTLLVPIALLASVTASQTFATGHHLAIDARVAGVAAGALALLARAPFIVVVGIAGATAALLRALT